MTADISDMVIHGDLRRLADNAKPAASDASQKPSEEDDGEDIPIEKQKEKEDQQQQEEQQPEQVPEVKETANTENTESNQETSAEQAPDKSSQPQTQPQTSENQESQQQANENNDSEQKVQEQKEPENKEPENKVEPPQEEESEKPPEKSEEEIAQETAKANEKTKKDFENKIDSSEDFSEEQFKTKNQKFVNKVKKQGAIIELLEPRARNFQNVPQSRNPLRRKNCLANSETKSHYLTSQGSKNYIQWRVKRPAKDGNCTLKFSADGKVFQIVQPVGAKGNWFPCGRSVGYESVIIKLPKNMVTNDHNNDLVVMQFEMQTHLGPIIQCSDLIVQKTIGFQAQKCDPHCKNGGVCQQGKCKCGAMFYGESCEYKTGASGAFSLLLFIFVIALVIAGIGLLHYSNLQKNQQPQQNQGNQPGQNFPRDVI